MRKLRPYCILIATVCVFWKADAQILETNDFAHAFTYLEEDTLAVDAH